MAKRNMNNATRPRCALLSLGVKKHMPATASATALSGKAGSSRLRWPNGSIKHGWEREDEVDSPKGKEMSSAANASAPACVKLDELG